MAVARRLVRASGAAVPSALRAVAAAHGALEASARLLGNARAGGRLFPARLLRFGGAVEFFVTFRGVLFSVLPFVPFAMFRSAFRGQRFVVHFVGKGVGFFRRVLMIGFVVGFVIFFAVGFLIGVQRFLQLFEFCGLDERFGHRFDRLGPVFGVCLCFFVLGFGKLLGERVYILVGKAIAIRSDRFRRLRMGRFGFRHSRGFVPGNTGGSFESHVRGRRFLFFGRRC
jgi:hypothetical protein